MPEIAITATPRSDFGKGAARRLRGAGQVPAVIYGKGATLTHVSLPGHDIAQALRKPGLVLEITLDGTTQFAAPKDVQRHPVKREIEHVDLVLLDRAQRDALIAEGAAIVKANAAAEEAGFDPTTLAEVVVRLMEEGTGLDDAIAAALLEVEAHNRANAAAASAAAEHEEADAAAAEPVATPEG